MVQFLEFTLGVLLPVLGTVALAIGFMLLLAVLSSPIKEWVDEPTDDVLMSAEYDGKWLDPAILFLVGFLLIILSNPTYVLR